MFDSALSKGFGAVPSFSSQNCLWKCFAPASLMDATSATVI
jgi:hypothetical protein